MSLQLASPPPLREGAYTKKEIVYTSYTELADEANNTANKQPTYYETSVNNIHDMNRGDLWVDISNSTQNMFRYEPNYTGVIAGYYWNGTVWSDYQEEYTASGVDVWVDVDDIKIYQYKTDITVSKEPKTGEFATLAEAIDHLKDTGGTIRVKEGEYVSPSGITELTIPDKNITIYADATDNVTLKNYIFKMSLSNHTITFKNLKIVVSENLQVVDIFHCNTTLSGLLSIDIGHLIVQQCTLLFFIETTTSRLLGCRHFVIDGINCTIKNNNCQLGTQLLFTQTLANACIITITDNTFDNIGMGLLDTAMNYIIQFIGLDESLINNFICNRNNFTNITALVFDFLYKNTTVNIDNNNIQSTHCAMHKFASEYNYGVLSMVGLGVSTIDEQPPQNITKITNNTINFTYNTTAPLPSEFYGYIPINGLTIPSKAGNNYDTVFCVITNNFIKINTNFKDKYADSAYNLTRVMDIRAASFNITENKIVGLVQLNSGNRNSGLYGMYVRYGKGNISTNTITIDVEYGADHPVQTGIYTQGMKQITLVNNKITAQNEAGTSPITFAKGITLSYTTDSVITNNILDGFTSANAIIPNTLPDNNNVIQNNVITS